MVGLSGLMVKLSSIETLSLIFRQVRIVSKPFTKVTGTGSKPEVVNNETYESIFAAIVLSDSALMSLETPLLSYTMETFRKADRTGSMIVM